jgi:hypothetical protein
MKVYLLEHVDFYDGADALEVFESVRAAQKFALTHAEKFELDLPTEWKNRLSNVVTSAVPASGEWYDIIEKEVLS